MINPRLTTGQYNIHSPVQVETGDTIIHQYMDGELDAVILRHRDGSREILWQHEDSDAD